MVYHRSFGPFVYLSIRENTINKTEYTRHTNTRIAHTQHALTSSRHTFYVHYIQREFGWTVAADLRRVNEQNCKELEA